MAPGESQARGFKHAHDKKTTVPSAHDEQYRLLREAVTEIRRLQKASTRSTVNVTNQ